MSIDNNLFNNISSNPNISNNQKEMIYKYLISIKNQILDPYISDFDFDNISYLLQNFKIIEGSETDIIRYDKNTNSLVLGKSPNNQEFNAYKSLLNLICQRYDQESNKINSGLVVTIDGKEYGIKLNDLLTDYIITINTGLFSKEDMDESKINSKDVMVFCFEDMAGGAEKLIDYFANGNGEKLYSKISEYLGESNTKELYSDNVSVDRLLLSTQACKLKREQINNDIPKM